MLSLSVCECVSASRLLLVSLSGSLFRRLVSSRLFSSLLFVCLFGLSSALTAVHALACMLALEASVFLDCQLMLTID
jgi:hypothetical protein